MAAMLTFAVVTILCLAIFWAGCGGEVSQGALNAGDAVYQDYMEGKGCEPATFACQGSSQMECNADHVWEVNVDCTDYEPEPRACCAINGRPNCYLVTQCEGALNAQAE